MASAYMEDNCASRNIHLEARPYPAAGEPPLNFYLLVNREAWRRFLGNDLGNGWGYTRLLPSGEDIPYMPASERKFRVLESELELLRFVEETIFQRYIIMESNAVARWSDVPASAIANGKHTRLRVVLPRALWDVAPVVESDFEEGSVEAEAVRVIGNITRLGTAAGVELIFDS